VLEATRNPIDELLKIAPAESKIAPADMTNDQLEIAVAFCRRQLALWGQSDAKGSSDIEPVEIEKPVSTPFGLAIGNSNLT
jgi:hypothetical protein